MGGQPAISAPPDRNRRFPPEGSAFVLFAGALDDILRVHEERIVSNDNTVRRKGRSLRIPADRHHYVKARVRLHPDHALAVFHSPGRLVRAGGSPFEPRKAA